MADGIVGPDACEPMRIRTVRVDRRNQPLAERPLAMADDGRELRQPPQLERREIGFDDPLVIGGWLSRRPAPGPFDDLPLADVLRGDQSGVVVRAGEDQFVAQIQHENVRIAFVQRAVKGRVSLSRENHGRARFADDPRRAMVRECRFRARDDLLSLVGEEDDEVGLLPFVGGFVEPAERMKIIREFQDRIDVKPLGLELLGHRDADDLSAVDLIHRKRRLVRAKNFSDFRVDEEFEIRAERSLNAAKLLGRLTEKSVAKSDNQIMRTLVPLVHQRFDGGIGILLVEQEPVNVRDRHIGLHVSEDFKAGLNGDLRLASGKTDFARARRSAKRRCQRSPWHTSRQERSDCP